MAILGLALGSFLNVLIYRLPRDEPITSPPSRCPQCGHRLAPIDLIPVISWLVLRGRCRYCDAPIPYRYPLVELASAALFTYSIYRFGFSAVGFVGGALALLLLAVSVIDFEHQIIPNELILAGLALFALQVVFVGWSTPRFLAGLGAGGILALVRLVSRGGMGGGDVKLAFVMGLNLGVPRTAVAMFFAVITAGVLGVVLLGLGLKGRRDAIPFGPFLALGGLVGLFWGSGIWRAYRDLM